MSDIDIDIDSARDFWRKHLEGIPPLTIKPFNIYGWDLAQTPVEAVAQRVRDLAASQHNAASANHARIITEPDPGRYRVREAEHRLLRARTDLYAADVKLAALVREADVKAKIDEVEEIKKETLAKIERADDQLMYDDAGESAARDLDWDFLDDKAKEALVEALKALLRVHYGRVATS